MAAQPYPGERLLLRIRVGDRGQPDRLVVTHDVNGGPVRDLGHQQPRDALQQVVVIQRGRERAGRMGQEGQMLLGS